MITFFNCKSIYLGYDRQEFDRILAALDAQQIRHEAKTRDLPPHKRPIVPGADAQAYRYEYEILVHEDDFDRIQL